LEVDIGTSPIGLGHDIRQNRRAPPPVNSQERNEYIRMDVINIKAVGGKEDVAMSNNEDQGGSDRKVDSEGKGGKEEEEGEEEEEEEEEEQICGSNGGSDGDVESEDDSISRKATQIGASKGWTKHYCLSKVAKASSSK
jgi:hypothetical protein